MNMEKKMRRELFAVLVMAVLILRTAALTDPLLKAFCSAQKDCAPQVRRNSLRQLALIFQSLLLFFAVAESRRRERGAKQVST